MNCRSLSGHPALRDLAPALLALTVGLSLAGCAAPERTGSIPSPSGTASPVPTTPVPQPVTSPPPIDPEEPTVMAYEDGTYEARGWYGGLPSHHDVTLTIEADAVVDVQITTPADDETSLGYQQRFAEALPGAIIGRPVDDLAVDRLAGSSGCSEGFMDALAKIKDEALVRA